MPIRGTMDTEKAFNSIMEDIKNERFEMVRPQLDSILDSTDDVMIKLKCASILKTIDDEKGCQEIVDLALDSVPDDRETRFDIAMSVRSLGRAEEAYELVKDMKDDPAKVPEIARTLNMIDESEEAYALIQKVSGLSVKDRILLCDILCSLGEFTKAEAEATAILDSGDTSYASYVNMVSVLMKAGKVKEANKFAKSHLKQDKKNVDSLALEAYVMWINGRIPAAANYANRALQIDYSHSGALETMAMCLIEKKKYVQAKMLAGVINEKDPKDPAVIRILDACRIASNA